VINSHSNQELCLIGRGTFGLSLFRLIINLAVDESVTVSLDYSFLAIMFFMRHFRAKGRSVEIGPIEL
jgi:hypothetical protein